MKWRPVDIKRSDIPDCHSLCAEHGEGSYLGEDDIQRANDIYDLQPEETRRGGLKNSPRPL